MSEVQPDGADILAFPRERFVIREHHCRAPGPEAHLICLEEKGHVGDHVWSDWRGCRIKTSLLGAVPFGGFAH